MPSGLSADRVPDAAGGGLGGRVGPRGDPRSGGHAVVTAVGQAGGHGPVPLPQLPGGSRPAEVEVSLVGAVHQTLAQPRQEAAGVDAHVAPQLSRGPVGVGHVCHMLEGRRRRDRRVVTISIYATKKVSYKFV